MRYALLLAAAAALAQTPVGLVVEAASAELRRAGSELPLAARPGDLLFPGDGLATGAGRVRLWFCPGREEYSAGPGSALEVGPAQIVWRAGRAAASKSLPVCALPAVDARRLEDVRFYGARLRGLEAAESPPPPAQTVSPELAAIDQALAADPGNPALRLARAATLSRLGLRRQAIEEYRKLPDSWPSVDWPRQLVHEEEDQARRAGRAPAPAEAEGRTYALLVGISDYPLLKETEQLRYAHRDAETFAEYLRSPRGGALPEDRVKLLVNRAATTAAVRNAIATCLRARAAKQDTVILFVAAHGIVDRRGAYVVTHDSNLEDLRTTALPMVEIQRLMEEELAHVGRVLLYIDVCRAGTIGTIRRNDIGRVVELYLRAGGAETFALLASRPGEVSFEHERFGGGHGAFSYFVLRGFNGEADEDRDGRVNVGEILRYVSGKVRQATVNQQNPRESGTLPSDAILIRDTSMPGIVLADWKPLDAVMARRQAVPRGLPAGSESRPEFPDGAFAAEGGAGSLEAENRLRVALQDRGQSVLQRYLRGEEVPQRREDFEYGERCFRAALNLDPDGWALASRALFCQGRARIFEKRYPEAVELLERAARIDPQGAYLWNALGIAYLELGQYGRAAPAFRDAIRRAPHWVYPVHNLALALGEQGDYSGAIARYQDAMRLAPQAFYLPYNLGLLYQRLNRRREAEAAYRKAVELGPDQADPYNALGLLKASSGKEREAESLYRKALEKNPKLAAARHNLALLVSGRPERLEEALELWRRNAAEAPELLASRLSLAEALGRAGRMEEARREYEAALRLSPDSVSARLALAELHSRQGDHQAALAEVSIALRARPGSPIVLERLGDARAALGQKAEAARAWREALQTTNDPKARKRLRQKLR